MPTIVRNICLQLARFWLYSRRPEGKGFPENVKETYAQALKDLERIQNGKLHIGLAELNEKWHKMPYLMCRSSKPEQIKKMDLSGY